MGQLTRIKGGQPTTPSVIELRRRTVFGRSEPSDVRIDEPSMSRQHAVVVWRDDRWVLLDLESLNGTRIDGRTLARGETATLSVGTEIVFGSGARWQFTSDAAPGPEPEIRETASRR